MTLLTGLYREALDELSDAAWMGGVKAAVRNCRHFPTPAELRELAEEYAVSAVYDRLAAVEQKRLAQIEEAGRLMLASGRITPERVAENAEAYAEMTAAARDAMRPPTHTPEPRDDYWTKEARDRVRRHRHLNAKKGRR